MQLSEFRLDISDGHSFVVRDFHFRAECFRRLILRNCSVDWNSKWVQGLTHLSLVDMPYNSRLGCHDFTLILSKIPYLETLHLSEFFRGKQQSTTKVQLQHLQLLSLNSDIPEIAQFLPCLVVPRSCNLRFFSGNDPIDEEFRTIFSWISNQLRIPASDAHDQGQYIRSFHLFFDPNENLKVQGFCDVLSHDRLQSADPILEFVVRESNYDSTFDLDTFLSLFPLGGVTFLDVFVALGLQLSPKFWATMFGSIQTLTTVYLAAETSSFWKALAPANSVNSTVRSLSFPALVSVTVEDRVLDSRIILDKLRVRSQLGGTQLQSVRFSPHGVVPPEHVQVQLGELVSLVGIDVKGRSDAYLSTDSESDDEE